MNYTKGLFVLFQQKLKRLSRYLTVQRPNALEHSLLAKLPVELLQQITNDLPVASAASFSLSCRHIHLLTGTRYLENLATSSHETLVFLKLIERDLQNQILCNSCRKLHRIQDARKYTENGQPFFPVVEPDCLSNDREIMVTQYIHDNFSTAVFKMLMKHYRLFGYDARSRQLLNLVSERVRSHTWGVTLVLNRQAECRISNGSLFTCKRVAFHGKCTGVEPGSMWYWICPHLELERTERPASLRIITSYPSSLEKWSMILHCEKGANIKKTSWDLCSELQQCRYCRTEYKAVFEHGNGCTFKFTITIWKDLGQGPEGEEWKAQLPLEDGLSSPLPIHFHRGEIASVFQ
ncbi:hypothetical protein DL98DRAFT_209943 [Cadophora sp. DSE1049]|nr:hypothetical protein DL98DRAFT_209943 [Cadophora sp. DSE1049]